MSIINIANMFIPVIVLVIVIYAWKKKINVYESFINGAKDGLELSFSILPNLIAMLFAVNIFLKSGIVNNIFIIFKPLMEIIKVPVEIIPMVITRPISGNASFAVMIDLVKSYGVDSFIGRLAQTMQGATDTTIYVIAIYFGSVGIKKIKYALWAGLITDLFSMIISVFLVYLVFN